MSARERGHPFLRGGHQERGRRAGTENAPYIVGLGAACELAMNHMTDENTRVPALRDKLEKGLLAAIPDAIVNGDVENRLPNTSNIAFQYVEGEAILLLMDQLGICARLRFGLHFRQFGTFACAACYGRSLHLRAWLHPFLAVPVYNGY